MGHLRFLERFLGRFVGRFLGWLRRTRKLLGSLPRRLAVLSLTIMAGIALAGAIMIHDDWSRITHERESEARNLALAVGDELNRLFGEGNAAMDRTLGEPTANMVVDQALRTRMDQARAAAPDLVGAILIVDQNAVVLASNSNQFVEGQLREDLRPIATPHGDVFGRPLVVGGERWLPMARPFGPIGDGHAAIMVMLRLPNLAERVARLRGNAGYLIDVFDQGGDRLVREPEAARKVASEPSRGGVVDQIFAERLFPKDGGAAGGGMQSFSDWSGRDGIDRLNLVSSAGSLPLGVRVGVPGAAFWDQWWLEALMIAVLMLALLGLMMLLQYALASELWRRQQAEARIAGAVEEANELGKQYRLLAEHSSDAIIQIAFAEAICMYASPAMEQVLGWTSAELVGQSTAFLVHPDDAELLHEEVMFLTTNCGPLRSHFRALHRDGQYLWIEASMQVVHNKGAPDSFVANMRDISDRIETERRLAEAASEMALLAATDQLTGVANRRRFNQELAREWRRAAREEAALSLLLLDVDFFKSYNDFYGHQGGDDVLRLVAHSIRDALQRPADLVARWGGEEFVVLLPTTDLRGAIEVAEHVRAAVEAQAIPHRGAASGGRLTVSVGVATAYPSRNQAPEPLVAEADANLYEAKRQGRNRVGAPPVDPVAWTGSDLGEG